MDDRPMTFEDYFRYAERPPIEITRDLDARYRHTARWRRFERAAIAYAAAFRSRQPKVWARRLEEQGLGDRQWRVAEALGPAYLVLWRSTKDPLWARALVKGSGVRVDGHPLEALIESRVAATLERPDVFASEAARGPRRGEDWMGWYPTVKWQLKEDPELRAKLRAALRRYPMRIRASYTSLLAP